MGKGRSLDGLFQPDVEKDIERFNFLQIFGLDLFHLIWCLSVDPEPPDKNLDKFGHPSIIRVWR